MILETMSKSEDQIEHVQGLRPGHDQRYAVDSSKIRKLGWKPSVTLEEGLKRTVEWYKENRKWWERVKTDEYQEYYKNHYGR